MPLKHIYEVPVKPDDGITTIWADKSGFLRSLRYVSHGTNEQLVTDKLLAYLL